MVVFLGIGGGIFGKAAGEKLISNSCRTLFVLIVN